MPRKRGLVRVNSRSGQNASKDDDRGRRSCSAPVVLLGEVERVLRGHGVEPRGDDVVLVACSGGMDSIVLAHATQTLLGARRTVIGHVDHRARQGSEDDAAFVTRWAETFNLPVCVVALPAGPASEARLREARYAALASMQADVGARWTLTAHTADDQAETVLLALLRTGRPRSMRGIPLRRGAILRPLLRVTRREVRAYAERHALTFRDDPTNREPAYLRNRVRKELLPLLETRYRAGMAPRLNRLARRLAASEAARRAHRTERERVPATGPRPRRRIDEQDAGGQRTEWPSGVWSGAPTIACALLPWSGGPASSSGRRLPGSSRGGSRPAVFDADQLSTPVLRTARPGDRITPFGMHGRRKVRDLLREAGVPVAARAAMPVVAREDGPVLWVPGIARSGDAPVGPLTHRVWAFWITPDEFPQDWGHRCHDERAGAGQLQVESRRVTLEPIRLSDEARAPRVDEAADERKGFEGQESE